MQASRALFLRQPLCTCSSKQVPLRRLRPPWRQHSCFSVLMYMGSAGADDSTAAQQRTGGDDDDGRGDTAPAAAAVDPKLRSDVEELRDRVDHLAAQLQQLEDRGRAQAVSLAYAVRETAGQGGGEGNTAAEQRVQRQEEEQQDERSWEAMMDTFTQVLSKGYILSSTKIRDRLLVSEWELARKPAAMRRGVSAFESSCANDKVDLPFDIITQLYEDPLQRLGLIADPHLRMHARACIKRAVEEEYASTWAHCTDEAQRLAQQFSNAEFIKKILPENGLLEALKKVVPMALKIVA